MANNALEKSHLNLELRAVFDSIGDNVVVIDRDMVVVEVNQATVNQFHCPREDIIGHRIDEFLTADSVEGRLANYRKVFEEQVQIDRESGGHGVWFQTRITPLFDENGDVPYISIHARNITKQHEKSLRLRESEAQFKSYFELGLIGMAVSSLHGNWIYVNDHLCEMLGYAWRELTTIDWITITHPHDRERDQEDFRQIIAGEIPSFIKEKRFIHKNGDIVYTKISCRSERDEEGEIDHLISLIDDISDQKRAEKELIASYGEMEKRVAERTEELRQSEGNLREFVLTAVDRYWETDADLRIIYVSKNSTAEKMKSRKSFLGKTVSEISDMFMQAPGWKEILAALETHSVFRDMIIQAEDGAGNPLHVRCSASPKLGPNGDFLGYRGTTTNITADVMARKQAEDIQLQFYEAMENLDAGFILWDADSRFVTCNSFYRSIHTDSKDILKPGLRREDYIRYIAESEWAISHYDNVEEWANDRILDEADLITPVEYQLTDGRWFRIRKQRMANNFVIAFHIEITDIKQREDELYGALQNAEIANKTKSEFLANMSHELRTPLNAVIGFSGAILHGIFGEMANDNQHDYLNNINEAGNHLLEVINDILDVSAIEAGQFELKEENVSLAEVSSSALRLIEQRAHDQGVEIFNHLSEADVTLYVDELRFRQILLNLLSNAVKFTPEGGNVDLKINLSAEAAITISVTDTGIGMSEHGLQKAVMTFGQVENQISREYEGTGLGIPLTKSFVEAHGGTLEFKSELGAGTTVNVHLPKERLISMQD